MGQKCTGIVLSIFPYNDKTYFVHIYSNLYGRATYKIPATRSKRAVLKKTLFMPFSVLEMEVEHIPGREIQKIIEVSPVSVKHDLLTDPVKNALVMFLAEILSKTIREQEQNLPLFNFIRDSIELLQLTDKGIANFHIMFIISLSKYLGFMINTDSYQEGFMLDMIEGEFVENPPMHPYYINKSNSKTLHNILNMTFSNMDTYMLNRSQRTLILDQLLYFFKLHITGMQEIKSLNVLKELFV